MDKKQFFSIPNDLFNAAPSAYLTMEIYEPIEAAYQFFQNDFKYPSICISGNGNHFPKDQRKLKPLQGELRPSQFEFNLTTLEQDLNSSGNNDLSSENVWEMLKKALESKSVDSFKNCCVDLDITNSVISKKEKSEIKECIIKAKSHIGLYPGQENIINMEIGCQKLASTTAFAVSSSQIFLGNEKGEVVSYKIDFFKSDLLMKTGRTIFAAKNEKERNPFSVLYLKNTVFQVFNNEIKIYNIETGETHTEKKSHLKYPAVTDGCQIFSFDNKKTIYIFEFSTDSNINKPKRKAFSIKKIRSVLLSSTPSNYNSLKTLICTDGSLITFSNVVQENGKVKVYQNEIFSLVSGQMVSQKEVKHNAEIDAWIFSPLKVCNIIIANGWLEFLDGFSIIPKWIIGYTMPTSSKNGSRKNNPDSVFEAIESAVYEGATFFSNGNHSYYNEIYIHVFKSGNIPFLKAVSVLCTHYCDEPEDIIVFLNNKGYEKASALNLTLLTLFVFLSSFLKTELAVDANNYVSDFIEKEDDLHYLVFIFYNVFDFQRLQLTQKATEKLTSFVLGKEKEFPYEARSIMISYCKNYVIPNFTNDRFNLVRNTMKLCFDYVLKSIDSVIEMKITADNFFMSTISNLWMFYVHLISRNKSVWFSHIFELLELLEFSISKNNEDLIKMLAKTFILYLEMVKFLKYGIAKIKFDSVDAFYCKFPHFLNGKRREIDQQLIQTLNGIYKIHDEENYADLLFALRQSIITEKKEKNISDFIVSEGNFKFLEIADFKVFVPLNDTKPFLRFLNLFHENHQKMNQVQRFIIWIFSKPLIRQLHAFDHISADKMKPLLEMIEPFMIPTNMVQKYNFQITYEKLIDIDGCVLESNLDRIFELYKYKGDISLVIRKITNEWCDSKGKIRLYLLTNTSNRPLFHRQWAVIYAALINGAEILDINNFQSYCSDHVTCGNPPIIKLVMKCITRLENLDKYDLKFSFKFLFKILNCYISHKKNPFFLHSSPSKTIESLFVIIQYMKEMFNSNSGQLRNYIIQKVEKIKKQEKMLPIFAILNNSFEVLREGVEVHLINESLEQVTGKVLSYDQLSASLIIINMYNEETTIDISKCMNIWCLCPTTINFHLIEDLNPFVKFFFERQIKYEDDRSDTYFLQAFKLGSLYDFLMNTDLYNLLNDEQMSKVVLKKEWPEIYCPEQYMFDFGNCMAFRCMNFSPFLFINTSSQNETTKSTEVKGFVQKAMKMDNGMIVSMFYISNFVSSPIHPMNAMSITFKLKCTKRMNSFNFGQTINLDNDMRIRIYGLALPYNIILQSDDFLFDVNKDRKNNSPKEIIVQFLPKIIGFKVFEDGVMKSCTLGSPSVAFYFLSVDLNVGNIAEYKVDYSFKKIDESQIRLSKLFGFSKPTEKKKVFMKVTTGKVFAQIPDSAVYNELCIRDASAGLIDSFRTLISIYHFRKKKNIYYPNAILRLLASIDPLPADYTISLKGIRPVPHWKDTSKYILEFIIEYINQYGYQIIDEIKNDVDIMCDDDEKPLFCIKKSNKSALFIREGQDIRISNCYAFCADSQVPLRKVGYLKEDRIIVFTHSAAIVPFLRLSGTLVEYLLHMRHLVSIMTYLKKYDFDFVKEKIDILKKKNGPYFVPLFKELLLLINVINPKLTINNCFYNSSVKPLSYLINESQIHNNPDHFLLVSYCEYFGSRYNFTESIPLNFGSQHKNVYLAVHDKGSETEQRFEFDVNLSTRIKSNSYIILNISDNLTMKPNSPNFENNAVEIVICNIPDIKKISEELKLWRSYNSHQLMYASTKGVKSEDSNLKELFLSLPLSNKFSFETAKFVLKILETNAKVKEISLPILKCHLVDTNTTNDKRKNCIKERGKRKQHKRKSKKISSSIEQLNTKFPQSHSFEVYKDVCDTSKSNYSRVYFLKGLEWFSFSLLDPDVRRIEKEISFFPDYKKLMKKRLPNDIFVGIPENIDTPVFKIFIDALKKLHTIVLLLFIEFCTGKWGTGFLANKNQIFVYFSENAGELRAFPANRLIVVGKFADISQISKCILQVLQDFSDKQLDL